MWDMGEGRGRVCRGMRGVRGVGKLGLQNVKRT